MEYTHGWKDRGSSMGQEYHMSMRYNTIKLEEPPAPSNPKGKSDANLENICLLIVYPK